MARFWSLQSKTDTPGPNLLHRMGKTNSWAEGAGKWNRLLWRVAGHWRERFLSPEPRTACCPCWRLPFCSGAAVCYITAPGCPMWRLRRKFWSIWVAGWIARGTASGWTPRACAGMKSPGRSWSGCALPFCFWGRCWPVQASAPCTSRGAAAWAPGPLICTWPVWRPWGRSSPGTGTGWCAGESSGAGR